MIPYFQNGLLHSATPNTFGKFSEQQNNAILCYESKPKTADDTKAALLAKYPDFSSFYMEFEGDICGAWQPEALAKRAFEPLLSNVPVLILSGEYNPVCPPAFGKLTAKTLPRSTFIIVPTASHAAIHVDDCLRNIADTFLSTPAIKPAISCISGRSKINFVTGNLIKALSDYK